MEGSELRGIRIAVLHMSQRDLAGELGVPVNTVARWERNEVAIQHPQMLRLALRAIQTDTSTAGA